MQKTPQKNPQKIQQTQNFKGQEQILINIHGNINNLKTVRKKLKQIPTRKLSKKKHR